MTSTQRLVLGVLLATTLVLGSCAVPKDFVAVEADRSLTAADAAGQPVDTDDENRVATSEAQDPANDASSNNDAVLDSDNDAVVEQPNAPDATPPEPPEPPLPSPPTPAPDGTSQDARGAVTVADLDYVVPGDDGPTGLTDLGQQMFEQYLASGASVPEYQLAVDVDPSTGDVHGAMRVVVPAQERTISFRVFAGMPAFDSGLTIGNVHVNGEEVAFTLDAALLSVPASAAEREATVVELDFRYTIAQMAANTDLFGALNRDTLQPDQVGLLGRTESGMQLGHWFPVWLPDGSRLDPDPSGFGDIGAFPAASICATISVPRGYEVVTSGSRTNTADGTIVEAGLGLRDLAILISDDLQVATGVVNGVEIRVWGPVDDTASLKTVLTYSEQSHQVLDDAFGPYPWKEIDVVSAPLGAGVGGMEWPGMIWVEKATFAGGLPGMEQLDDDMRAILESIGGPALATTLEWTIAHEFGHEWWHATVGNDSIESPAVDEPLAQFSACLVMETIHPDNWQEICQAQTTGQYAQARSIGVTDTAAEQASDRFDSPLQYGAIVYGKAPGFYLAAADLMGWPALTAALRSFVDENAFALVSTDALRDHLIAEAGDDGEAIGNLWDRWFRESKGDEDIEATSMLDLFGGAEGIDGLDIDELFEDLVEATE